MVKNRDPDSEVVQHQKRNIRGSEVSNTIYFIDEL